MRSQSCLTDALLRRSREEDAARVLEDADEPLTTAEVADRIGMEEPLTSNVLQQSDLFLVEKQEHVQGAARRNYWTVSE